MIDKIILKDLKINFEKLLGLGFIKKDNYYEYETKIIDNQFSLIIKIDKDNSICSDVIIFLQMKNLFFTMSQMQQVNI
ncbi:MAG: hypothetical protein V8R15_07385 [Bacilli bacterium]